MFPPVMSFMMPSRSGLTVPAGAGGRRAYGAMTQFNRNGFMVFSSYRDPNLAETLDVLDETADYVRTFDVSDREMDKFIIGTMSGVDAPMTPQMITSA